MGVRTAVRGREARPGQLDMLRPGPERPDVTVFGDWLPGPQPPSGRMECRCGCGQGQPGRCWNCGKPVPWQWND